MGSPARLAFVAAALTLVACGPSSTGPFDGQDNGGGNGGTVSQNTTSGASTGTTSAGSSSGTNGSGGTTGSLGPNSVNGQLGFQVIYARGSVETETENGGPWVPFMLNVQLSNIDGSFGQTGCGYQSGTFTGGNDRTFSLDVRAPNFVYPNGGVTAGQYQIPDGGAFLYAFGLDDFSDYATGGTVTLSSFTTNPSDGGLIEAAGTFTAFLALDGGQTSEVDGLFDVTSCP